MRHEIQTQVQQHLAAIKEPVRLANAPEISILRETLNGNVLAEFSKELWSDPEIDALFDGFLQTATDWEALTTLARYDLYEVAQWLIIAYNLPPLTPDDWSLLQFQYKPEQHAQRQLQYLTDTLERLNVVVQFLAETSTPRNQDETSCDVQDWQQTLKNIRSLQETYTAAVMAGVPAKGNRAASKAVVLLLVLRDQIKQFITSGLR